MLMGRADEPVCWSLCGFASGYLSYANGREIYCLEETCVGKGDAVCRVVARDAATWGERLGAQLAYFKTTCLAAGLEQIAKQLKTTERRLRVQRHRPTDAPDEPGEDPSGIVSRSEQMKQVLELARRAAKVDSTVLVTGRERRGQGAHRPPHPRPSPRARAGPFVAVNCARGDREPAGERAVRPRPRRLHRRHAAIGRASSRRPTAAPCSWTRSARCSPAMQAEAAARPAGAGDPARRRDPAAARSTCASSPPPTATLAEVVAAGALPPGPLLPAAGRSSCACRRCASAATTSSRWPGCFCRTLRGR